MKAESSDLILAWSKGLHWHLWRVLLKKSIKYQLQISWPDFFKREVTCCESHMAKAPGFMPRWAQVPGPWPADLGGIHYIMALLLLRSRKEHQPFLDPVQVVWRRERSPSNALQARSWRLLEEMWPSQLLHQCIDLGWPGCLVKLIATALALQKVNLSVSFHCNFLIRLSGFAFLLSVLPFLRSLEKGFRAHKGTQANRLAGAREVSLARWKEAWAVNWEG